MNYHEPLLDSMRSQDAIQLVHFMGKARPRASKSSLKLSVTMTVCEIQGPSLILRPTCWSCCLCAAYIIAPVKNTVKRLYYTGGIHFSYDAHSLLVVGPKWYKESGDIHWNPYPSIRTLQRRLKNITFESGVLETAFTLLKLKVFRIFSIVTSIYFPAN